MGFGCRTTWSMPCESCGACWTEADRQRAVRAGEYVHDDPDNPHRSFHIPGTAHLWRTVESIVRQGAIAGPRRARSITPGRITRCSSTSGWAKHVERMSFEGLSARRMHAHDLLAGLAGQGRSRRAGPARRAGDRRLRHGRAARSTRNSSRGAFDPPTGQGALRGGCNTGSIGGGAEDNIEDLGPMARILQPCRRKPVAA